MTVMLPFSQSSCGKHSQWSDNGHDGSLYRRTSRLLHSPTTEFILFPLSFKKKKKRKVLHVDIKKKEVVSVCPQEASGLSSQWHTVLPESSSPNMRGREEFVCSCLRI